MDKQSVIEFFDRCAPNWDAEMIKNDTVINRILDNAEVGEGMSVLDVACGTGVMFDYYLSRGVSQVVGIDISPEMAKIAAAKYAGDPRVQVICGDVEEYSFEHKFDRIVVYNAFPHFPHPKRLIKILSQLLNEDGRLTVAHGASREAIDGHHSGAASKVSNGLMDAQSLKRIFDARFDVEVVISNRHMYQVSGVKRDVLAHSHGGIVHSHGGITHSHSHGEDPHDHVPNRNATPSCSPLVSTPPTTRSWMRWRISTWSTPSWPPSSAAWTARNTDRKPKDTAQSCAVSFVQFLINVRQGDTIVSNESAGRFCHRMWRNRYCFFA